MARTIQSTPLKHWLAQRERGERAKLARKLGLESQAVLTNWLKRGIPLHAFPEVCAAIGMSEDRYRAQAGLTPKGRIQGDLDSAELLSHFEALPPGLRAYITRKTRRLRETWENNPILRDVFTPPKDRARYREWEREIEALILRLRPDDNSH